MPEASVHTIAATTHGRYLVRPPADAPGRVAVVGFHGYGQGAHDLLRELEQGAHDLLRELERLPGAERCLLVSVQGLHCFYARGEDSIVASWMTRQDRDLAIADNVAYVETVVAAVRTAHPFERLVFLGFSQGTAMASRAAAQAGAACHGLILLGGDIAPEVRAAGARLPRTVIGRGSCDRYYPAERFEEDREWLEDRGALGAAVEYTGGHEFTDTFRAAAGALIASLT